MLITFILARKIASRQFSKVRLTSNILEVPWHETSLWGITGQYKEHDEAAI